MATDAADNPTSGRRSREDWVRAGFTALERGGVSAVKVEPLARALGVTKGSFYWHFADRGALLRTLLEAWEELGTAALVAAVDAGGGDARARIRELWRLAHEAPLHGELAIRDWARRAPEVAVVVARVDSQRLGYLRRQFRELGLGGAKLEARCLLFYSLLVGDHFIAHQHGRFARQTVLAAALEQLLGGG